jgi:Spy/CpxP family protein refolding chaperone
VTGKLTIQALRLRRWMIAAVGAALLCPGGAAAAPQGEAADQRSAPPQAARSVAEVEQLFDRYVLGQARQALRLDPGQMRQFAPRLQRLQVLRRRALRQQRALVRELGDLTRAGAPADETALAAKLRALEEQAARADQEVREAYVQLEQVLTVDQRARLRVFEQRMERRKLDLISQARQQARPDRPAAGDTPE